MPWSRALNDVKEGKIDILPATWFTQERTAYLTYSDNYLTNQVKFIKKAGDNFEFAGLASLNGKKVGIVRGYGYGDEFMNDPSFFRPESTDLKQIYRNCKLDGLILLSKMSWWPNRSLPKLV